MQHTCNPFINILCLEEMYGSITDSDDELDNGKIVYSYIVFA